MPSILHTAQNLKTLIRIRKIHTKVWDFLYKSLKTQKEMKCYEILHQIFLHSHLSQLKILYISNGEFLNKREINESY